MHKSPRSIFISHGGGPLPLLGDEQHREMVACLQDVAAAIPRPEAIVLVSAHWEEKRPTITATPSPALIYDYYGFPPESYEIKYPCTGEPSLAREVLRLLTQRDIDAGLDEARGLDHGAFVPLKIMYPEADIPCVQVSLVDTLSPSAHIEIGRALESLHRQNVLVIGSGFSFHNLRAFVSPVTAESSRLNEAFEDWLEAACGGIQFSEQQRQQLLVRWNEAPGARYCHPREEHLLPLHVCYGVAQSACTRRIALTIMNRKSSMYLW